MPPQARRARAAALRRVANGGGECRVADPWSHIGRGVPGRPGRAQPDRVRHPRLVGPAGRSRPAVAAAASRAKLATTALQLDNQATAVLELVRTYLDAGERHSGTLAQARC